MRARRIRFTGPGKVAVEPANIGAPLADQLLVETLYTAISPGTERAHLLAEHNTLTRSRGFPFQPGYSNIGRILEVGSEVASYRPGQLVATAQPHVSHFVLPATVGPGLLPAKYRDQFTSAISPEAAFNPHHLIWPLPQSEEATLKACATFNYSKVGLGGVRRARVELGEPVVIIGLGPIGLYAAQYARLSGAFPVLGVDPSPSRRQVASHIGLDAAFSSAEAAMTDPVLAGTGPAVVIEATGKPEPIVDAFRLCARNGRVVLLGSTRGVTERVHFYTDVHRKGLTVIGAHELTRPVHENAPGNWTSWDDGALVLRLICAGRLNCGPLLTHEFPVDDAAAAYRVIQESPEAIAVVLRWR